MTSHSRVNTCAFCHAVVQPYGVLHECVCVLTLQVPELTDNDAVNIFTLEDAVYVASETNFLRRVDVESLATQEKVNIHFQHCVKLLCVLILIFTHAGALARTHTHTQTHTHNYYHCIRLEVFVVVNINVVGFWGYDNVLSGRWY